jgi:hypothetical protein
MVVPVAVWNPETKRMRSVPENERVPSLEPRHAAPPALPEDGALALLLEVVYHASFLTEEGRRLGLRVIYLPPASPEDRRDVIGNLDTKPIRLIPPRPLNPAELLRIAPAADPAQTLIVVGESNSVGMSGEAPLAIWALLHLGRDWFELVSGRSSGATCPPNALTVSSFSPGALVISARGSVLLRLRDGALVTAPLGTLREGPIGRFLQTAAQELYTEVCVGLGQSQYDPSNTSNDDHPKALYFSFLSNVFTRAREARHGGSFAIVPDDLVPTDSRLADRLNIKYVLDGQTMWQRLVDEAVARRHFYNLMFPEDSTAPSPPIESNAIASEALYDAAEHCKNLRREIGDFESFTAALSGVDGIVVLTTKLRLLGFGGEITAISPSLSRVRVALNEEGDQGIERPITAFGTRHRSAFRFCSSFEDVVCIVLSQDGQVRGIKRVGPDLRMWNDLDLREQVL